MRFTLPLIFAAAFGLTACDPAGPGAAVTPLEGSASAAAIAGATCNAELYSYLIGGPIEAAQQVDYRGTVRILGADEFVTKDFLPNRLTITTTPQDTVGRVFCG